MLEKRESGSRDDVGIVPVKTTGYNQDGTVIMAFRRTVVVYKRGCSTGVMRPEPEAFSEPL